MNADAAGVAHDAALDLDLRAGDLDERGRILEQGVLYPASRRLRDAGHARLLHPGGDVDLDAIAVVELRRVLYGHIAAVAPLFGEVVGTDGDVADEHVVVNHEEDRLRLAEQLPLLRGDGVAVAVHVAVGHDVVHLGVHSVHGGGVVLHGDIVCEHGGIARRLRGAQLGIRRDRDAVHHRHCE